MRTQLSESDRSEAHARSRFERETSALRKRIDAWAYHLLGNRTDAEDIVQETLARAWHKYPTFDPSCSFDAWVYRIAVNLCYDQLRSRKRRHMESLDALSVMGKNDEVIRRELPDASNDPEARVMALQVNERLLLAIRALPSPYRACFGMHESGLGYKEIARVCQCPLGTIRSRLSRARHMVRKAMAAQECERGDRETAPSRR